MVTLTVIGLILLAILLGLAAGYVAHLCFSSFFNWLFLGSAFEACVKGIGWCLLAICQIISEANS